MAQIKGMTEHMKWKKTQGELSVGDCGMIVVGYHDDYGMIPAWVRILERHADEVTCEVTEPIEATGSERTTQTFHIGRVMPVPPALFEATLERADWWFDDASNSRLTQAVFDLNLRMGNAFDEQEDGTFVATEYGAVDNIEMSVVTVRVPR